MPSEVKAQDTTSLASIKTVNEAATQSRALLAEMEQAAEAADTTLNGIYQDAKDAQTAADSAERSADTAYTNLSQIQSVLEVAQWIATHGTYVKATVFNPNATYYTITATQVTEPSDDDKDSQGVLIYYELDNGIYVRTTDTSVDEQKTYYRVTGTPVAQPSAEHIADYYTLAVSEAMADYVQSHLALTDEGLWIIKDGSGYKLKLTNYGSYIVAPDGITVVNQNTADGNIIRALDGTVIAHLGFGEGQAESGTAEAPYYTLGERMANHDIGNYSVAEGIEVTSSGYGSHAEGWLTTASGNASHAEGVNTVASQAYSHAEGQQTTAAGYASHAEGYYSTASGSASHAQNRGTVAGYTAQTAIGKFNDNQQNNAFEIGNGTSDGARSNGFTVDWDGRVECGNSQGKLTSLLDLAHPKGSTYGTVLPPTINGHSYDDGNLTDADKDACGDTWFDPRIMWGGTWGLMPEGYILLSGSESGSYQVGTDSTSSGYKEYGANTKNITVSNMPSHDHAVNESDSKYFLTVDKSPDNAVSRRTIKNGTGSNLQYNLYSENAITRTSATGSRGSGSPFNVMQKSVAVYTWIRTA